MTLQLHVFPPSPRAFKVLAVANHLGLAYEPRLVHLFEGEQDRPAFVALNPNRRMPVLCDDGFVLWEANAITQYLAAKAPAAGLGPRDAREQADINRWQFWDLAHWEPAIAPFIRENVKKPFFGQAPDPQVVCDAEAAFDPVAAILEDHLTRHDHVACGRLTVADFALGAVMNAREVARLPVAGYSHLLAWHARLQALPAWGATAEQARRLMAPDGVGA
jgi:glutathione S-transferase